MDSRVLYFAQLPQQEIDRYQTNAHLTCVPSDKFLDEKVSEMLKSISHIADEELAEKFRDMIREKYQERKMKEMIGKKYGGEYQDAPLPSFPDVPVIISNYQSSDNNCILSILGLKGFYDHRIGYIPDVVMVDFFGSEAFHLLFPDGTVKWYYEDLVKTYSGKYKKIVNGEYALTTGGEIVSLCPITSDANPFHIPLPRVIDFFFYVQETSMGYYYDINYITLEGVACYSDMKTTISLMEKARKILCYSSTTFVLTESGELYLFRKGVRCDFFLIKGVIDIYHRYLSQEKMEIVAIVQDKHIIHSFDDEAEFKVSTCPRLAHELEIGDIKYVIEL